MKGLLKTFMLICVICSVSIAAESENHWTTQDREKVFDRRFDFLEWAGKSAAFGVFHVNMDIRKLMGSEYIVKNVSADFRKAREKARDTKMIHDFQVLKRDSDNQEIEYVCRVYELGSIRAAHREMCSLWMRPAAVIETKHLPNQQIGNKHFVSEKKNPRDILFTRGNVLVSIGTITKRGSVIPLAKRIDRGLMMMYLTDRATCEDRVDRDEKLDSARDIEPGEKIVVTQNVRKEKKSLSVVSSSGTLYLNDKDQLILDTTGTEETKIRVWEVERKTYRTGKEEQKKEKPESDGAQEGGVPTLDSGPGKNKRKTHPQNKEKEKEKKDSPPPVTDTLGDTE